MKAVYLVAVIFTSFGANAKFVDNHWVDDMNDTSVFTKSTKVYSGYDKYQYLGFECRIDNGDSTGRMAIKFSGGESIATPNSEVDVKIRVDKGQVYDLTGRTYNNSYTGGLIKTVPESLYSELKTGNEVHLNLYKYKQLKVSKTFSLEGSTEAINFITNKCGITIGEDPAKAKEKKKINDFYDAEIKKLESERKTKLNAVK